MKNMRPYLMDDLMHESVMSELRRSGLHVLQFNIRFYINDIEQSMEAIAFTVDDQLRVYVRA